jgi:hypothetical protein
LGLEYVTVDKTFKCRRLKRMAHLCFIIFECGHVSNNVPDPDLTFKIGWVRIRILVHINFDKLFPARFVCPKITNKPYFCNKS